MTAVSLLSPTGAYDTLDPDLLYERLEAARVAIDRPFTAERMALVSSVGDSLLRRKEPMSGFVRHFAFWIRTAALNRLSQNFAARLAPQTLARARGLVFHLPPQNVETVFLYSWVLSYLSGNANVIRLPSELSPEMRAICQLFITALAQADDTSQFFIHYPTATDIGARLSAISDARVVWGGDAKIAAFAPLPLRHGGKSIWFGDRFSFCVMNGAALSTLDDKGRVDLAARLYNDVFVFDQMACSSPHILYVTGDSDTHLAGVNALLDTLAAAAADRREPAATGHVIAKMVQAFSTASDGGASQINWRAPELTTIIATTAERREMRVGGGFLRVAFIPDLSALPELIRASDQTVTHYGFSAGEIGEAAESHAGFGVSRWAPVGAALDFDFIWDGYDLPFELTRIVRVG